MHGEDRSAAWRRLRCRLVGHRWQQTTLSCLCCRRTKLEIERGPFDPAAEQRVTDSYWRGVEDGRKVDRRRAYRLGYMRGGRDAFARVEGIFRG